MRDARAAAGRATPAVRRRRDDPGAAAFDWRGGRSRSVAHACSAQPLASGVVGERFRIGSLTRAEAEREWQALSRRGVGTAAYRVLVSEGEPPPAA